MYIEPYGLLDIDVLETYIKSVRVPAVTRCIKMTYMAIDSFLNGVTIASRKKEGAVDEFKKLTGIESTGKATLLYNKLRAGKPVNIEELGGVSKEEIDSFINSTSEDYMVAPNGEALSDFQSKFVTHLKMKYNGYRRGKHVGIKFILNLIDRSETQSSATPYILNRSVEKVMAYQSESTIIKALNIRDKRDVAICIGNITNFEEDFLNSSEHSNESRIKSLIAREPELNYLLTQGELDLNSLSVKYLTHKINKIDHNYFNQLLGTNLTDRQMHKEFMDLTRKGLVGFNLCKDYLLNELVEHGSGYDNVGFDVETIKENSNINFIINNLKPLLQYELDYGG